MQHCYACIDVHSLSCRSSCTKISTVRKACFWLCPKFFMYENLLLYSTFCGAWLDRSRFLFKSSCSCFDMPATLFSKDMEKHVVMLYEEVWVRVSDSILKVTLWQRNILSLLNPDFSSEILWIAPPRTLISQVPCHKWRKSHPWTCCRKKFRTAVCTAAERERTIISWQWRRRRVSWRTKYGLVSNNRLLATKKSHKI